MNSNNLQGNKTFYAIFWHQKNNPAFCGNGRVSKDKQNLEAWCRDADLSNPELRHEIVEISTNKLNLMLQSLKSAMKKLDGLNFGSDPINFSSAHHSVQRAEILLTRLINEANKASCSVLFFTESNGTLTERRIYKGALIEDCKGTFFSSLESDLESTEIYCIQSFDLQPLA